MKRIVVLFIIICSLNVYSQEKDSIIYIFPDKVEQKLYEQIESNNKIGKFYFRFYLESIDNNKFRIFLSSSGSQSKDYWTDNTNRFILINEKKYPLRFDYDSFFSTKKPNEVGEFGHREGVILRSLLLIERYNITFDKDGFEVKESWGISKKR